ncbi:MAG TPA: response regulator [Opitutaceae bacterium]
MHRTNQIQENIARAARLRDVDPQGALGLVENVRESLRAAPWPGDEEEAFLWLAECAQNAAWANVRLGRFAAAGPEAEEGLRLFRQIGSTQGAAGCLLVLGIADGEEGRNVDAVKRCLEAETLFLEIGDHVGRARAINASGTSYRRLGDSARAIEAYGASLAIAQEHKDSKGVARALSNIGYVYLYERKFEQAIENARKALSMEKIHGNIAGELSNCCNLVQALVGAGRPQEAVDFVAAYDLDALSKSGLFSFLELTESVSMAYIMVGRTDDAGRLLSMGIERARRDGNHRELGSLLCTFARLKRTAPVADGGTREDRLFEARTALDEALAHLRTRDWDYVQAIHEEYAALCRDERSWDEAFEHLEAAQRIALRMSSASADERLARQRADQAAADQQARAQLEARQHEVERNALKSQKAESLGVLAGGMVHHFNNLLTSILGNAELAEQNHDLHSASLAEIKAAGRRAADLCQQIEMYTGRSVHLMAPVDLKAVVQESIKLLKVTRFTECEIFCEFPPEPVFVWGDRAELQQIFLNLLTNSAEAHATAVVFTATVVSEAALVLAPGETLEPGSYVEVCASDNGEGMKPEVQARIFEPFFTTRFTGRGLGLPAAMGLIQAHKGAMSVESTAGSGTTIRLHLPVAHALAPVPPKPRAAPGPKAGLVVLVAEDEEAVRRVIVMYMKRLGWTILEAADGEEAVRMCAAHPGRIDLLLSDYIMPKVNGLQVSKEARSRHPGLPVILMSGFTNEATVEEFRTDGFEHFLRKPFQLHELSEILDTACMAAAGS